MRNKIKSPNIFHSAILGAVILVALFTAGKAVFSATIYPAGSLLQPNDVTSSHIRDNTIVNADVNTGANISATMIAPRGTQGTVLLTDGTNIATTTAFKFATSTADLYVFSGRVHATSTNFGGLNYTWPTTRCASGETFQENGSGTLSCVSVSPTKLTTTATTNYTTTSGMAMGIPTGVFASSLIKTTGSTATSVLRNWGTVATPKVAQSFLGSDGTMAWQVSLTKTATPGDSVALSIQADSAGSPSGTDLVNTSIVGSTLIGSCVMYVFTMPTNVTLTAGSTYWAVLTRSGSTDNVNYYSVCGNSTNAYANGGEFYYNGTVWTADTNADFTFKNYASAIPGQLFPVNATNATSSAGFLGFAQGIYATSTTATISIGGEDIMQSGLTAGTPMYLSNTDGVISSTAGTVTRKVCIATASTKCVVTNIW